MTQIIHSKIQKWGNSLGIRISGVVRELTNFEADSNITIEIFDNGFTVKKVETQPAPIIFSEEELLEDISAHNAHSDLLAAPSNDELGI